MFDFVDAHSYNSVICFISISYNISLILIELQLKRV